MAAKKSKVLKRTSFVVVQKLIAASTLLAFFTVVVIGLMANVSVVTIAIRSVVVFLVVGVVGRIVVQVLSTYEEMNSGKA